jgi:SAM-dependent methyltransferase
MLTGLRVAQTATDVEELYDAYPYPAHGIISSVVARLLKDTVVELESGSTGGPLRYLDAGCGTGEQTLGVARDNPSWRVTGIDFSERSLVFARNLAERNRLESEFIRKDLTSSIADLGRFDLVTCIGALHHLPDPALGLRALREVCASHTVLLGMVYGTFGKWELFRVRDALRLLAGPSATRAQQLQLLSSARLAINVGFGEYLRTLLRRRRFGPGIAWSEALRRVTAGRSASYQADAYTHPRETSYTWAELAELLSATGWRLVGWPKRSGMPDDAAALLGARGARYLADADLLTKASVYERLVCPQNLYFLARPRS